MRLQEAVQIYERYAPDVARSTIRKIGYEVNRWQRLTHIEKTEDITLLSFSDFRRAAKESGLSPRTIETNIDTVHLLFSTANRIGQIDQAPPPKGRRMKSPEPTPEPVTVEEIEKLCHALDCATWPLVPDRRRWWRSWMSAALWTGIRLTDITWRLSPEHFLADHIAFRATKTSKLHVFPLSGHIHRDLYFLQHRPGKSPHILRKQLKEFCSRAGVRELVPKNFRQASVTLWSIASPEAGTIVHGCGLPKVMKHYLGVLNVLQEAAPRFPWPSGLTKPIGMFRQPTLF